MPKQKYHGSHSFVQRTYAILSDPSVADIVSWDSNGRSFEVRDVGSFATKVLPKYFKHSNFTSFVRQLNMYDFRKEPGRYAFIHPFFMRGQRDNLKQMKRKPTQQSKLAASRLTDEEMMQKISFLERSQQRLISEIENLRVRNDAFSLENSQLKLEIEGYKEKCRQLEHIVSAVQTMPLFPLFPLNAGFWTSQNYAEEKECCRGEVDECEEDRIAEMAYEELIEAGGDHT